MRLFRVRLARLPDLTAFDPQGRKIYRLITILRLSQICKTFTNPFVRFLSLRAAFFPTSLQALSPILLAFRVPIVPLSSQFQRMAVAFTNLGSQAGLQKLNEYLLTRSYISGYQASKDDLAVYAALNSPPSEEFVNAARWYTHIDALIRLSGVTEEGKGVKIESSAVVEDSPITPPVTEAKAPAEDDDDDDVDLFGEETEEEKKAAEERAAAVKASAKKKESGKSSVLLDVKPWDDETDMKKLEEAVRSVQMEGLLWGASKLVPVGAVILLPSTRSEVIFGLLG
ncbi:Elongation factor 1-beta [Rhynchospora pubera]|uniref:Elongation factor 1-beta n=1 Tax=Rhynchospora pubera TaxID=906938 RepID=A0AAV8CMN5_9POAL|nr:Elongation factor 1-beta [Rhynchospora pubera]